MAQKSKSEIISDIDKTCAAITRGTGFYPYKLKRDELVAALVHLQTAKNILTPPNYGKRK